MLVWKALMGRISAETAFFFFLVLDSKRTVFKKEDAGIFPKQLYIINFISSIELKNGGRWANHFCVCARVTTKLRGPSAWHMETISSWRVHGGKKANLCWPFLLRFTQAAIHGILRRTPPTQILNQTPTCLGWTGTLHMAPWLCTGKSKSSVNAEFQETSSRTQWQECHRNEGDGCPF